MSSRWKIRIDPDWPRKDRADLYLEGSDQHRGWFQSSLLESCGTRGRAPYDGVLTHGFVLDEQGRKMSKSLGNTSRRRVIAEKNGAEILRLWAASSDFTEDLRIGQDIIKANVDAYRRLRNTIRFMLANLAGFDEDERIGHDEMPELERFMLARAGRARWQLCARPMRSSISTACSRNPVQFLHQRPVGVLFRHPQGRASIATRRTARAAAPRAR